MMTKGKMKGTNCIPQSVDYMMPTKSSGHINTIDYSLEKKGVSVNKKVINTGYPKVSG